MNCPAKLQKNRQNPARENFVLTEYLVRISAICISIVGVKAIILCRIDYKFKTTMINVTLSNGVEMPMIGYGVYQVDPAECERCVSDALSVGYRMIDTGKSLFFDHHDPEVVKMFMGWR